MTGGALRFNPSSVFKSVAAAIPDETLLVWRDRRLSYAVMDARIDGVANYLAALGLGSPRRPTASDRGCRANAGAGPGSR